MDHVMINCFWEKAFMAFSREGGSGGRRSLRSPAFMARKAMVMKRCLKIMS